MPNNSDAAFAELEKAVTALRLSSDAMGEDALKRCYPIHHRIVDAIGAFAAYKEARGRERQLTPEMVVFVPTGETRVPENGDWFFNEFGEACRCTGNYFMITAPIVRRIDIAPAPKAEKTRPISAIVEELEITSYANSTIDSLKEDVCEALRAIERRLNSLDGPNV